MPVLALRLTALAALVISVSGCVMEAYGSRARSDAQSWIGLPIQDVIKRFGEPERVTGDAARQKYVWKEYENYSHDYDYTYYEQGHGNTPNSLVLNQKTGTANQSGYYTCIVSVHSTTYWTYFTSRRGLSNSGETLYCFVPFSARTITLLRLILVTIPIVKPVRLSKVTFSPTCSRLSACRFS